MCTIVGCRPANWSGRHEIFEPKFPVHEDIMKLENKIPLFVVKIALQWEAGLDIKFNFILRQACHTLCPFPNIRVKDDSRTLRMYSHLLEFVYKNIISFSDITYHTEHSRMCKNKRGISLQICTLQFPVLWRRRSNVWSGLGYSGRKVWCDRLLSSEA